VHELIGRGAYSKVKRVVRYYTENGEKFEDMFAMKVSEGNIKFQ
jgi:[calcium/calmodulin-dependent protein kinase] kinase